MVKASVKNRALSCVWITAVQARDFPTPHAPSHWPPSHSEPGERR